MVRQAKKLVYRFDEGDASMRELLGGKGANLSEMARLGLPVPPDSPSPPKRAATITRAETSSPTASGKTHWSICVGWRGRLAGVSAPQRFPCWCPCARELGYPCRG